MPKNDATAAVETPMTDEEVATANKKAVIKAVALRIALPIAAVVVAHVVTGAIVKKLNAQDAIEA